MAVAVEEERLKTDARSLARERRAKGRVRLHGARGSVELREVATGSATPDLWLRNGKVRSQVSGIDQSRFPGRRTVGES